MIYLEKFSLWSKIFNRKNPPKYSSKEKVIDNINYLLDYYCIEKDHPISVIGYTPIQYEGIKESDDISFQLSLPNNQNYTLYSDGRVKYNTNVEAIDLSIYQKAKDIFFKQRYKWLVYIYASFLSEIFFPNAKSIDMKNFDVKKWNSINKLNDDFSFFRYPNIVNMRRLEDLFETDCNADLSNTDIIPKLEKFKSIMKKIGITVS